MLNSAGDLYYTGRHADAYTGPNLNYNGFTKLQLAEPMTQIDAPVALNHGGAESSSVILTGESGKYYFAGRQSRMGGFGKTGYSDGFQEITSLQPNEVKEFAFIEDMTVALTTENTLKFSGYEQWSSAGNGGGTFNQSVFTTVSEWGNDVADIYQGRVNFIVKKTDGSYYYSGNNNSPDLGTPAADVNTPRLMYTTSTSWYSTNYNRTDVVGFKDMITMYETAIGIDADGYLRSSGPSNWGQSVNGWGSGNSEVVNPPFIDGVSTVPFTTNNEMKLYKITEVVAPTITLNNLDEFGNNPETITFGEVPTNGEDVKLAYKIVNKDTSAVVANVTNVSLQSANHELTVDTATYPTGCYVITATRSFGGKTSVTTTEEFCTNEGIILEATDITVEFGSEIDYLAGVTAKDAFGVDLLNDVVVDSSNVDETTLGTYTATYTVTDSYGYSETVEISVTIQDTTAPTISGVNAIELDTNEVMPDYKTLIVANDNYDGDITDSIVFVSANPDFVGDGTDVPGAYTLTYTVTDSSGNVSAPFEIKVGIADTIKPVITAPGYIIVPAGNPLTLDLNDISTLTDGVLDTTALDNVDGDLTASIEATSNDLPATGENVNTGAYLVYLTVTDAAGNVAETVIIKVVSNDYDNPFISGRVSSTVEAGTSFGFDIAAGTDPLELGIKGGDVIDGDITSDITVKFNFDGYVGDGTDAVGSYSIVYTLEDSAGNIADDFAHTIVVVDTISPTLSVEPLEYTIEYGTAFDYNDFEALGVVYSDSFDKNPTVSADTTFAGDGTDAVGTYEIFYTAEDASGNTSDTVGIKVHVVDTTKPEIAFTDSPVVIEIGTASYDFEANATVTDNYDTPNSLTTELTVDSSNVDLTSLGEYVVTYTAVDTNGNTTTERVTVQVVDTTAPEITGPISVEFDVWAETDYSEFVVTDNSGEELTLEIIGNDADVSTVGDYAVTLSATDSSGNTTSITIEVKIVDTLPPEFITFPGESGMIEVEVSQDGEYVVDYTSLISVMDNTRLDIEYTLDDSAVDYTTIGEYLVHVVAEDPTGNITEQFIPVLVVDTTVPVIEFDTETGTPVIEVNQDGSMTLETITVVTDNSGEEITAEIIAGEVFPSIVGVYPITISATDSSGNVTEMEITVIVEDTTKPEITGPASIEVEVNTDPEFGVYTIVDNSGEELTLVVEGEDADYTKVGVYTIVVSATDSSGNKSTFEIEVNVVDTLAPEFTYVTGESGDLEVEVSQSPDYVVDFSDLITVNDNSLLDIAYEVDDSAVDYTTIGEYTIVVTAVDESGNTTEETVAIRITDTVAPTIEFDTETGTPVIEVNQDGSVTLETITKVTDNSGEELTAVVVNGEIDSTVVGEYPITISATDSSGNITEMEIVVSVIDTTAPDFTIEGDATFEVTQAEDPGYVVYGFNTALQTRRSTVVGQPAADAESAHFVFSIVDNSGEELTPEYDLSTVNHKQVGDYMIETRAVDSSGNVTAHEVAISIEDTTAPEFGTSVINLGEGETLTDDMFMVTDNSGEAVVLSYSLPSNLEAGKTYQVEVTATDAYGNVSTSIVTITTALPKTGMVNYAIYVLAILGLAVVARRRFNTNK